MLFVAKLLIGLMVSVHNFEMSHPMATGSNHIMGGVFSITEITLEFLCFGLCGMDFKKEKVTCHVTPLAGADTGFFFG